MFFIKRNKNKIIKFLINGMDKVYVHTIMGYSK